MNGNTWAIPDGDLQVSDPYKSKEDAKDANWQCNLEFWNEWQKDWCELAISERVRRKAAWLSAIKDGSWLA